MKTIEKYLNEDRSKVMKTLVKYEKHSSKKKEQDWTVIKVWYINAKSNTDAVKMSKKLSHDEVIIKKGRPLIKGLM